MVHGEGKKVKSKKKMKNGFEFFFWNFDLALLLSFLFVPVLSPFLSLLFSLFSSFSNPAKITREIREANNWPYWQFGVVWCPYSHIKRPWGIHSPPKTTTAALVP
jgi:hypothetical protein